jgi:two-component system, response regulator PdtaR
MKAPHSNSQPAILVVEDEFWVMQDVADSLAEHGFEVHCARNADEALALVEKGRSIDVIFTDINMPGARDGLALAREVRQRWPRICVLITSGRNRVDDLALPDENAFIPKPYQPKTVIARIAQLLGCDGNGREAAAI